MEDDKDFELSVQSILKGIKGIATAKLHLDDATKENFKKRKEICESNKCGKFIAPVEGDFSTYKCGKCGCWLKYKLVINSQTCPLKHW